MHVMYSFARSLIKKVIFPQFLTLILEYYNQLLHILKMKYPYTKL